MKAGVETPTQIHPGHQRLHSGITRQKALCFLWSQNRFPNNPLGSHIFWISSPGACLSDQISTSATSSHTADFSPPFFTHKEPDKATARSSMSASPNLPWAQLDTANTFPDLQQDMEATHTFTQECLWSQEMLGIFSWCSPWKNKQTHTPSDSPITWLLLGGRGGGSHTLPVENYSCVQAGTESTRYPALPQTSSSALGKSLNCHNLDINGREMHEYFSICSWKSWGNSWALPRQEGGEKKPIKVVRQSQPAGMGATHIPEIDFLGVKFLLRWYFES